MSKLLHISSSPHVRSRITTKSIMYDVILALMPVTIVGIYQFGAHAAMILAVSMISSVLFEYVFQKYTGRKITIQDGSALLTGLLLGLNMPVGVPFWIPILGSAFAILLVKQIFGGLGQNFMNPALGARCFLLISFTGKMTQYRMELDGITSATPLTDARLGNYIDMKTLFFDYAGGCIGEVSALAIMLGGIYLVGKKVIDWRIPIFYIGSFILFFLTFSHRAMDIHYTLIEVCGGGLMIGAWFMATDYVTSPITKKGRIVFGILLGCLTGIFRIFVASAEGVSYAIIIGNLLVPIIEKLTMPKAFGLEKEAS